METKFDLIDYLARVNSAVQSMHEILERGLYHAALEARFSSSTRCRRATTTRTARAIAKRRVLAAG